MNIYLLSQRVNNDYDTYSDCVVVAPDAEMARTIRPDRAPQLGTEDYTWTSPENVSVVEIGRANPTYDGPQVICASFHAG